MPVIENSLYEYCQARHMEELLHEWHWKKNGDMSPTEISAGSHKVVWWLCGKGHEWQAEVRSRCKGHKCPVCTNRKVIPGENDLATTHPDIAFQWHPYKNDGLSPSEVVAGTERKVWWICEKGHEWRTAVNHRITHGSSCPVCAGKIVISGENDLLSCFPDIADQWHPTLNSELYPRNIFRYSNHKVWWLCPKGHSYQTAVGDRTDKGKGCPYCSGRKVLVGFNDLATRDHQIAKEWYQPLNGELTPQDVTVGSNRKVWWQCSAGHVWKAVIYSRTGAQKAGCPVCAGKTPLIRERKKG